MAKSDLGDVASLTIEEAEAKLSEYAIGVMVYRIRAAVDRLNVRYDEWFPESRAWQEGLPQHAIEKLRESGVLQERHGALSFGPALEEEDGLGEQRVSEKKDRVVIRANGE